MGNRLGQLGRVRVGYRYGTSDGLPQKKKGRHPDVRPEPPTPPPDLPPPPGA